MSEKEFQKSVLQLFKMYGWMTAHFGNTVKYVKRGDGYQVIADKGAAGFPDITAVRGERLLFVELKTDKGQVAGQQVKWLEALRDTGAEVYVWRPRDIELIPRILTAFSTDLST